MGVLFMFTGFLFMDREEEGGGNAIKERL